MAALLRIIQKNFKLLIRSKSSSLIVILGPLLVIFLVGIAFDNMGKYTLNVGVYSSQYSELSESFILKLQEQNFRVQKIDTEELCIQKIKQGTLHTCMIFPPGLAIAPDRTNEIVFYVDHTKINLIGTLLDTLSTNLGERKEELSTDLTADLLNKISLTSSEIAAKKATITALKNANTESTALINEFDMKISDFASASSEMRTYILEKINGAKADIDEAKKTVDSSNASSSQKNIINMKISSVNTYLYNIQSQIEDPYNLTEADWERILRLANEVDARVSELSLLSSDSSNKINELEASLDSIAANLGGIQIKEASTIVNPITTTIKPVVPEKTYLGYIFPSLIILVIMFISILLSNTLVMMEKHSPAYFRNFITPTKNIVFLLATYITSMIIVTIQLTIILLISTYFFKAQLVQSLYTMIPGLLLISTLFTLVGMTIGYFFNSEETSTLAAISIGSIFLFLSNVVLPLESMPDYIRNFAQYNPFVIAEGLLRKSIFFSADFVSLANEFKWLGIYAGVLFIIVLVYQNAARKHLFHRFMNIKYRKEKKGKK